MRDLYIVRVLLIKLPAGDKPQTLLQESAEYPDQSGAVACFREVMAQLPVPPAPVVSP